MICIFVVSAMGLMLNGKEMENYIKELSKIVSKHGYWSNEVKEYNDSLLEGVSYNDYQFVQEYVKNLNGFIIERCDGIDYIPNSPKLQVYNPDDCDGVMYHCNTIDEAKDIINDIIAEQQ